jgi:hypothetical protein
VTTPAAEEETPTPDPLHELVLDLNALAHLKETPEGGRADVEGRLTWEELEEAAAARGVSLLLIPGSDLWCPTIGGYWRVLIAAVGDDFEVQNNHQALILEDSDSPHVIPSFTLFRYDRGISIAAMDERREAIAFDRKSAAMAEAAAAEVGPRSRLSGLAAD